jgi:hypothetical protein
MEQPSGRTLALIVLALPFLIVLGIFAVTTLIGSTGYWRETVGTEIARVASPNQKIDAVVTKYNPGTFGDFTFRLYLVPKGMKPRRGTQCFNAWKASRIKPVWLSNALLRVYYEKARIGHFTNRRYFSEELVRGKHYVRIQLAPKDLVGTIKKVGKKGADSQAGTF